MASDMIYPPMGCEHMVLRTECPDCRHLPDPDRSGILWIKACASCGAEHTLAAWRALPFACVQLFEFGEDETPSLALFEQRNCPCGSTLTRPLERGDPALWDLLAETERRRLDLVRRGA